MKIKVNDTVEVIAGDDRGERGKVLAVNREKNTVVVEGVNKVYKHIRRSQKNPQGGRLSKETPVAASNLKVICEQTQKPTRVGYRYLDDGSKERFAKVSGATIGARVSPARDARAKK
jgi:large subunit ribosomal protein L24